MPQVIGEPAPVHINGEPVATLVRRRRARLVDTITATLVAQVPFYADLPREVVDVDVRDVVRENIDAFVGALDQGGRPSSDALEAVAASGYRRAEEGIPMEVVTAAYVVAVQHAWRDVTDGVDDLAAVRRLTDAAMEYLREALATVGRAYLEEVRSTLSHEQGMRSDLLSTLLTSGSGAVVAEAALRAGVDLPAAYSVLVLEPTQTGRPSEGDLEASVTARRTARRMRTTVLSSCGGGALAHLDADGGTVLVPCTSAGEGEATKRLFAALVADADSPLRAAVSSAAPEAVPAAAQEAHELLRVARATARPPGLYRLTDMLVDYQLHQRTLATAPLAALLAPLLVQPALLDTLRSYLGHDANRKRVARDLGIHPNSVDYRLRRVLDLTGLDATSPSHRATIDAALAAADLGAG